MTTATLALDSTSVTLEESESLFAGLIPPPPAQVVVQDDLPAVPEVSGGWRAADERSVLIAAIRDLRATASPEWLAGFSAPALREYLEHLQAAARPRGRQAVWVRPRLARAITATTAPE